MSPAHTNWAGNHTYTAREISRPATLAQLRELLGAGESLQAVASRHSFSAIGDADRLIDLGQLDGAHAITIDLPGATVRVGPGVTFAQLAVALNQAGLALANLASLPHISVCGAIATATHGSGDRLGNLATSVRGMRILTAAGDIVDLGADDPRLPGGAVHLGLLGLLLEVTLAVEPYYEVTQQVFEGLGWEDVLAHLDDIFSAGRSVSIFHRFGATTPAVWVKSHADEPGPRTLLGVSGAREQRHPLPEGDPTAATTQMAVPGPWSERLPHFRSGFQPSDGAEIQSELFVPRRVGAEAVRALLELAPALAPILIVGELRTVAADRLWLSPQYERDSLGLHFTWQRAADDVMHNMALIERALSGFAPRPHWGKVFTAGPDVLAGAYPRAPDFARLRAQLDPGGVFINAWARERVPFLLGT